MTETTMTLAELAELDFWWSNNQNEKWNHEAAVSTGCVVRPKLAALLALARRALEEDARPKFWPDWLPRVGDMVTMLDMPQAKPVRVVELTGGWRCLLDDGSEYRRDCHVSNLKLAEQPQPPVPTGSVEVTAAMRDEAARVWNVVAAGGGLEDLARTLATREAAAFQAGRESVRGTATPHWRSEAACLRSDLVSFALDDDATDYVAQALADACERGRESAQGGWIAVEERLPEETGFYLCLHPAHGCDVLPFSQRGGWGKTSFWNHEDPSHWMPLPPAPGAEKGGG